MRFRLARARLTCGKHAYSIRRPTIWVSYGIRRAPNLDSDAGTNLDPRFTAAGSDPIRRQRLGGGDGARLPALLAGNAPDR